MIGQGYQLIIIENEKPFLTAGAGTMYGSFLLTLAVMLAAVLLVSLWFYLMRCRSCRKRLRELNPDGRERRGWNVVRLEQEIEELELDMTAVNFLNF